MIQSLLVVGMLAMLASCGCNRPPRDVTHDKDFGDFAAVVGDWRLRVPLRLVESKGDLYVVCEDTVFHSSRELDLLPEGAGIRIERLVYTETFETTYLDVWGTISSGGHSGKPVIFSRSLFPGDLVMNAKTWRGTEKVRNLVWTVDDAKLERVP